jgi:hypothetical protein
VFSEVEGVQQTPLSAPEFRGALFVSNHWKKISTKNTKIPKLGKKKRGNIRILKNVKRPGSENLQLLLLCLFVFFVAINPDAEP